MIAAGHPQAQAVAASLSNARRHPQAASGGGILGMPHMAGGGGFSPMLQQEPPWTRAAMRSPQPSTGYLLGSTPGRADLVKAQPPAGSYVWPADVLAGLGEGNSNAGAAILEKALSIGPMGTKLQPARRGAGVSRPAPPAPFTGTYMAPPAARGGAIEGPVDIMAAHGELITPPEVARQWGRGSLKKGHDLFDKAVLDFRKSHIKDLKGLKGPKKS